MGWTQVLSFLGMSQEGGKDLPKGFLFAGGFSGQGCVAFDWESVENLCIQGKGCGAKIMGVGHDRADGPGCGAGTGAASSLLGRKFGSIRRVMAPGLGEGGARLGAGG
jgi:hypothetical protein